jgi:hypothetical protein
MKGYKQDSVFKMDEKLLQCLEGTATSTDYKQVIMHPVFIVSFVFLVVQFLPQRTQRFSQSAPSYLFFIP